MNNFRVVLKNTLVLTLSEVILRSIGFFWVVYLAQTLTVDAYGRYNVVNAFLAIFAMFADMGVGLVVIREIAKYKKNASKYLGNAFVLSAALAGITIGMILAASYLFGYDNQLRILMGIAALTLFFSTIRSVAIFYFDGTEKMEYSAILNVLNTILLLSGAFIGFTLGFGLLGVFVGMCLGTVISLIISWSTLAYSYTLPKIAYDKKRTYYFLKEGFPLGMAAFFYVVYTRVDTVFLVSMLSERAAGIYNTATPFIFALIALLNVPFVVALYPALSRLSGNRKRFNNAVKKALVIIMLWSFPSAVCISFLSPFLIPLIFGNKFFEAIPVLQVLIFFVPFACLSALLYKVLIVLGKQTLYLFISIIGAFCNIVLNYVFISKFSLIGAAYASVLTQIILCGIYMFVVWGLLQKRNEK